MTYANCKRYDGTSRIIHDIRLEVLNELIQNMDK